jgi:hypothetical protein
MQASEQTNKQTGNSDTHRYEHAVLEAHHAARALTQFPVVPFKLKRPLVVSFLHGKVERERLLPAMTSAAYENTKIRVHAIAMSKPLDEPPAKVVLKRRHAAAMEAPVCARLSDTHSLVCAPNDAPDARWKFGFANGSLRRVADGKDNKKKMKMTKKKKELQKKTKKKPAIPALAADVIPLDLPSDLSAYDCKPWRRVRDVTAQAHFKAEEMRAAADKDYVLNIERALSRMETCPFAWDFSAEPFLDSILFVVWTSGEKKRLKYHLNAVSAACLCVKAGAKARLAKQK